MIRINILEDEELQELIDKYISGVLPHENYDAKFFGSTLSSVYRYIKLEEMSMEYYVMFYILTTLNKIGVSIKEYSPHLSRDIFSSALQSNIPQLVRDYHLRIVEWLNANGLPSNLDIETTYQLASEKLYAQCISLYDRCFEMKFASSEVLSLQPALEGAFINHLAGENIKLQAEIVNGSSKIGRRVYKGSRDWLDYTAYMVAEIQQRLMDNDSGTVHLDSLEVSQKMLEELKALYQPLAKYGIEPFDDHTPLLRHRLIVLAANEGVGKTTISVHWVTNLLLAGKKVLFMCGETAKPVVFTKILSNYIHQKYNVYITEAHISGSEECPEDKQKLINLASIELTNGSLSFRDSFTYDNLFAELKGEYESNEFDAFIIDHSLTLKGSGTMAEKVEKLAIATREFKKQYPVCIVVTSHLSVIAKEALIKGKSVSAAPTRGSAILSNEADEVFVLIDNEILKKQNLLGIQNYKRRNAPLVEGIVYIKKKFSVSAYEYDKRYQQGMSDVNLSAEQALKELQYQYDVEEEDDEEYLLEDED